MKRAVACSSALWRSTLDGVVVLAPTESKPALLQPPGDVIWRLLSEGYSPVEICSALADQHCDIPRERICRDVAAFIEELAELGAVLAD